MKIDKKAKYTFIPDKSGPWSIWGGEDFSDGTVLLYNDQTGEDWSETIANFQKYFQVIA